MVAAPPRDRRSSRKRFLVSDHPGGSGSGTQSPGDGLGPVPVLGARWKIIVLHSLHWGLSFSFRLRL